MKASDYFYAIGGHLIWPGLCQIKWPPTGNPIMNVDPDGHAAILVLLVAPIVQKAAIGAIVGGVLSTGAYLATTPRKNWNRKDAAINAGLGAATGALITSVGGAAAAGAAINAAWYHGTTPSKDRTLKGYLKSGASGAIAGATGTALVNKITTGSLKGASKAVKSSSTGASKAAKGSSPSRRR